MPDLPPGNLLDIGKLYDVETFIGRYMAENVIPPDIDSPIRGGHYGDPSTFGGQFPYIVTNASNQRDQHRSRRGFVEWLGFYISIFDIATPSETDPKSSGPSNADDKVRQAWSEWLWSIHHDDHFLSKFLNYEIPRRVEVARADRFGRELVDRQTGDRLWRLLAEVYFRIG